MVDNLCMFGLASLLRWRSSASKKVAKPAHGTCRILVSITLEQACVCFCPNTMTFRPTTSSTAHTLAHCFRSLSIPHHAASASTPLQEEPCSCMCHLPKEAQEEASPKASLQPRDGTARAHPDRLHSSVIPRAPFCGASQRLNHGSVFNQKRAALSGQQ